MPAIEVTEKQIDVWERQNTTGIFEISINDKRFFLRFPTDKEMFEWIKKAGAMKVFTIDNVTQISTFYLKKLWLGGDDSLITDAENHYKAFDKLAEMGDLKLADMKKRRVI